MSAGGDQIGSEEGTVLCGLQVLQLPLGVLLLLLFVCWFFTLRQSLVQNVPLSPEY